MRLRLTTYLPASPEEVWPALIRSSTFPRVARGLLGVRWLDPPPSQFVPGQSLRLRMLPLGLFSAWTHTLRVESLIAAPSGDSPCWEMKTREQGGPLRRWNHMLRLVPSGDGRTLYTDEVDLDAGLLTPLAWLMARGFFAFRQWRWRRELREILAAARDAVGEM